MRACPKCRTENEDTNRFCKQCGGALGSQQLELEDDDTLILRLLQGGSAEEGRAAERPARIWLLDPTGQQVERASELTAEVLVIGRREDCAIVLPSNTVSRRHAQIRREGRTFYLSDLGSTNGTLLNGEPVIGEEPLNDRDEIGVGTFKLIFRTG